MYWVEMNKHADAACWQVGNRPWDTTCARLAAVTDNDKMGQNGTAPG